MQPQTWLIDFEVGMIPALRAEYPGLLVMGCYYHFMQCLVRKLQELGLKELYRQDLEFQVICRQISAIAFVPIPLITESFNMVVASIPPRYVDRIRPFINYVQVCILFSNLIFVVCSTLLQQIFEFSRQKWQNQKCDPINRFTLCTVLIT